VVFFPRGLAGVMTDQIIPKLPTKFPTWTGFGRGQPGAAPAPAPAE
jgi:hypothetical protein